MHAARVATIVCAAVMAVQVVSASPVYLPLPGCVDRRLRQRGRRLAPHDAERRRHRARASGHDPAADLAAESVLHGQGPVAPEALAEMVLTFHLGRLARIVATYDRDRTEGLTNADLHDAFTTIYGTSMLVPTPGGVRSSSEPEIIGQWGDGETLVVLWREVYPRRFKVTVSSVAADRLLQGGLASGVRLEATEAPTRDMVRRLSEEQTQRRRDEQSRLDNKSAFKP